MITIGVAVIAGLVTCSIVFLALCAGSRSAVEAAGQPAEPPSDLDRMDGVGEPLAHTPSHLGGAHLPQRVA